MMYRASCVWRDLTDGHLYQPGDAFPFDGRQIAQQRIERLLTGKNRANKPLIEQAGEIPIPAAKPRKRALKPAGNKK